MMKTFMSVVLVTAMCTAVLTTSGCATDGSSVANVAQSLSVEQGYAVTAGIRNVAAKLVETKHMSKADAENVLKQTDSARTALDLAAQMKANGVPGADDKLKATLTVLTALQTYLALKGAQ
jgi:hypothetical protein